MKTSMKFMKVSHSNTVVIGYSNFVLNMVYSEWRIQDFCIGTLGHINLMPQPSVTIAARAVFGGGLELNKIIYNIKIEIHISSLS